MLETQYGAINLTYSQEKEKLGSGGAIKLASQYVTEKQTYIFNGDVLTTLDLLEIAEFHHNMKKKATMALVKLPSPYGVVEFENNLITQFREKPLLNVYIHSGVDIVNAEVLPLFPAKGQMEDTIFVELVNQKEFAAYVPKTDVYWIGIDTQKEYETANKTFPGF